ncbi:helix-turn-helix domain-containing protein [Phaeodactylibacter xiamenensis]|jgi:HTH-type transcriptional regulator/antitoxin HigA|uniref:helix-turn-helix domain-containing protein n=1 Tax=Phaeodactylibacter xiamenensis TaxID=1524460 RepID=UPI0024A80E8D|nr:helix-turn-helix domain-containing protein [Phaeodactylibacter xiamenensis]
MKAQLKYTIIKSLSQYTEYCNRHEKLLHENESEYQDEIELLELLIEDYDQRMTGERYALDPVALLKRQMESSAISQIELAQKLGVSRQLVNDILKYRRNISKEVAIRLSDLFAMRMDAFARTYSLAQGGEDSKETAKEH